MIYQQQNVVASKTYRYHVTIFKELYKKIFNKNNFFNEYRKIKLKLEVFEFAMKFCSSLIF